MQRPLEIFLFKGGDTAVCRQSHTFLLKVLPKVSKSLSEKDKRLRDSEVNVIISDGKAIRGLNKRFRGVDHATDVLSFPFEEEMLGEVWLCPSVVKKNAGRFDERFDIELVRVLVHGILHLSGHDHKRSFVDQRSNQEEMFKIQEAVVADIFDER